MSHVVGQVEIKSSGEVVNVININNFNNTIFNVIGVAEHQQEKPLAKTKLNPDLINLEFRPSAKDISSDDSVDQGLFAPQLNTPPKQQRIILVEAPVQKSMDFLTHQKYQDNELTIMWGYTTIFATFVAFIIMTFWMFGAKLLPETGNPIIDFMREDFHYCCVLPLLYPVFFIFIYKNWASLKAFRHN